MHGGEVSGSSSWRRVHPQMGKCAARLRPGEQRRLLEVFDLSPKKVENRIRKGGWAWILKTDW